jgi:hypothetical protein
MSPTPEPGPAARIGEWLPILGALAAAGAWLVARWHSCRRRKAAHQAVRAARDEASRVTLDATRFLMERFYGDMLAPDEQQQAAAVHRRDIDAARRALWLAEGHPDPLTQPDEAEVTRRVLRNLRRTQPLVVVDEQQDGSPFTDGWTEDDKP